MGPGVGVAIGTLKRGSTSSGIGDSMGADPGKSIGTPISGPPGAGIEVSLGDSHGAPSGVPTGSLSTCRLSRPSTPKYGPKGWSTALGLPNSAFPLTAARPSALTLNSTFLPSA